MRQQLTQTRLRSTWRRDLWSTPLFHVRLLQRKMSFLLLLVTAVLLVALPPGGLTTDPDPRLWFPTPYPLGWPYPPHGQGPYPYFSPYLYHGAIDNIRLLTNQLKEQSSQLQSLQEKMKLLESKLEKFTSDEKTSYNSLNQSHQHPQNQLQHLMEKVESIQTQVEKNSQDVKVLNSTQVTQINQSPQQEQNQLQHLIEEVKTIQTQVDKNSQDVKDIISTQVTQNNCCKHLTEEVKTIQTQVENNSQDVKVLNSTQVTQKEMESIQTQVEKNSQDVKDIISTQVTQKEVKTIQTQVEKNSQDVKVLNSTQATQRSQLEQQEREQEGQERRLQEQMKKLQDNSRIIQSMNGSLTTCEKINLSELPKRYLRNVDNSGERPIKNVALKKPSAQSSMYFDFFLPAELAVDGIKKTEEGYCQHTSLYDSTVWWMVDLQGFFEIVSVEITNRGDDVGYRLKDFVVEIHDLNPIKYNETKRRTCYKHSGSMDEASTEDFKCSKPIMGRFVRISMPGVGDPMHVCEVEVKARAPNEMVLDFELQRKSRAVGKILGELIVNDASECVDECANDTTCSAINVGQKTPTCAGRKGLICQILSYGGLQEPGSLVSSDDWSFYQITHAFEW